MNKYYRSALISDISVILGILRTFLCYDVEKVKGVFA